MMPDMQPGKVIRTRSSGGAFSIFLVLFFLGFGPIAALGVYTYQIAAQAIGDLVRSNNVAAATITRELVAHEMEHRINLLVGFSRGANFRVAVRRREAETVREQLKVLVESQPRVVRAFVSDPDGLLWSDFPKAPESLGKSFAHRDWYKGVSASWEPYVSEVYRRHAAPRRLLVAVAVPIRDTASNLVIGVVVNQITLGGLATILQEVKLGRGGFSFIVDHNGTVAAHPRLDLQERVYREYVETPLIAAAEGGGRVVEYTDPLLQQRMLATVIPITIADHRWAVVAQQPVAEAFRPLRMLALNIAGAGLLVALILTGLFLALARYHHRGQRMTLRLAKLNEALAVENRDRRRAESALQAANELLEQRVEERTQELRNTERQLLQTQKMDAIGQLAAGIAHDFNNLLTVIVGYCEILLRSLSDEDPQRNKIEPIHDAGKRAARLTQQLLAFSRKQVLRPEILDLNSVVENMTNLMRRIIGEHIELHTKLSADLHPVEFDPSQIEQILMNLVVNAREAMPRGGKLIIETENVTLDDEYARQHPGAKSGPHVMIAITDTGIGMSDDIHGKIFEPFFTTKERGTGLGLSTVFGIVKQSGGNIWVYSEPNRGTVVKVYLPRAIEADVPAAALIERPALPRGTETILLVEDEDDVRSLVRDVLEMSGYRVLETGNASEAIEIAKRHDGDIHLLLTDVVLPKMGGPDLANALSTLRPGIKVVYMSGYTDDAIVNHGVLEPGTAFVEKPIEIDTFLEKVREFLS